MARKGSATKKLLFILGGLVVVLVILGVVARATGLLSTKPRPKKVELATTELRDITQVVTASGKMQPEVEVKISPDVSGEIVELTVKEGDQVAAGELLVRIRPDFYKSKYERAEAGVLQARAIEAQRKADLLSAETEAKRKEELFKRGAIPESEIIEARTRYEVAIATHEGAGYAVESARAALREAGEELNKTAIYAPISGTVSQLNVEPGERVVGTGQLQGTEMLRIARLDQMELEVDINENDVVNVTLGDSARIEVDAYPDRTFLGIVTEIANSARVTGAGTQEQVTNFPVKIRVLDVHNTQEIVGQRVAPATEVPVPHAAVPYFRPGMSGTVDVFTRTVEDVIAVPIQAVTVRDFSKLKKDEDDEAREDSVAVRDSFAPEDLRKVVFVDREGVAAIVEVRTGISDDTFVEIESGLQEGDRVVIGPYRQVSQELEPDDAITEERERRST